MKPITIYGLSQEQRDMLDIMWNMETLDEVREWQANLDAEELRMSLTLSYLLVLEALDDVCLDDPALQATTQQVLSQFRLH